MSYARDEIHHLAGCESTGEKCTEVSLMLNRVEDDRAHREADRVRAFAGSTGTDPTHEYDKYRRGLLLAVANEIDPYEMRDGQLVRKSDGKPVTP